MHTGDDALQVVQVAWGREHESGEEATAAEGGECAIADLTLDKQILQESQEGNLQALSGGVAVC